MGKASRDKGARFERECVNRAKEYNLEARRTAYSGAMEWEKGDVLITPTFAPETPAWDFECKRRAKLPALIAALGEHKGLIIKQDRGETLAIVRFDDLLELLQ
jgi:Holliday junction resolvase